MATVKDIPAKLVAELRARTGAGMMDCKKALEQTGGDLEKAIDLLRKTGAAKADKRAGREASQGVIAAYVHHNSRVGVLVELNCETDFVANTEEFKQLAKDLTHQIASTAPIAVRREDIPADVIAREKEIYREQVAQEKKPDHVKEKIVEGRLNSFYEERALLEQKFVRDGSKSIGDMVKELSAKTGENVQIRRFARFKLGED
ncbi:MAG: translation elongation factor Ts [Gemmatimonadetes bacterium 13_1_40CM_69_22]|nr:MAG: translation elongation factor Ts [Gemmatimonadetes bacterium 13_1_40CM_69_22]